MFFINARYVRFVAVIASRIGLVTCCLGEVAQASACRSSTPKIAAEIANAQALGFSCEELELQFEEADLKNIETKKVIDIYTAGLKLIRNATTDMSVRHIGANFERFFYEGDILLPRQDMPARVRVSNLKIDFTYREKTLCTKFDESSGSVEELAIDATINVRGIVGLVGVCRYEVH